MTLLPADQWAVSEALADVRKAASGLTGVLTPDEIRRSLLTVRHASMKAYGLISDAESRAREAALAPYEKVA